MLKTCFEGHWNTCTEVTVKRGGKYLSKEQIYSLEMNCTDPIIHPHNNADEQTAASKSKATVRERLRGLEMIESVEDSSAISHPMFP